MKNINKVFISLAIVATTLMTTLCYSESGKAPSPATPDIRYTFLKDCHETVANENAAYSILACPDLAGFKVSITKQSPQYFNILLTTNNSEISSDFTAATNENPIKEGKAIEWHIVDKVPKFMVFRLSWGSDDKPNDMSEYLLVNLVSKDSICVLAAIDTKKNKNANEKAHSLILNEFKQTDTCQYKILKY